MRAPSPALLLGLLICLPVMHGGAAVVGFPEASMSLIKSDFSPDRAFTGGSSGSAYSRVETANDQGGTTTVITGTHQASGTRSSESAPGRGGTLTSSTSSSFNGTWDWSQTSSQGTWSFQSDFEFESALNYQATSSTYGNFFFVLAPSNTNTISLDRYARIVVDRPMTIQLALSATVSRSTMPEFFTSALVKSGLPDFMNMTTIYRGNSATIFGDAGATSETWYGTQGNLSFVATTRGTADGMVYDVLVSPISEGLSGTVELRWFIDYESELQKTGVNWLSANLGESGLISESLTVSFVPEPSCWLATLTGFVGLLCRRTRRTAGV